MIPAVADERLHRQGISTDRFRTPAAVVRALGAVQAQEFGPAKWALGLRLHGRVDDADVANAFDAGRILRTHVMRPTWHFVDPADIRWMQMLTAPRVQRIAAVYNRHLELDARTLTRGTAIVERALCGNRYLTRVELGVVLAERGIPVKGQRLAHLMMHAELEAVVCSGPRRGKQSTYALIAERAPQARMMKRDEALAQLTRRFFTSHAPATVKDFVWWSGLTSADAKRGLEINRARSVVIDALTYWTVGRRPRASSRSTEVHLLPIYDEYLVAYRDRVAVAHVAPFPEAGLRGAVIFQHAIVIDGQVAGTWRVDAKSGGVQLYRMRTLSSRERAGLSRALERYRTFIDGRPA